jgi:RNA polymerase sigma-70 factor (ECF subfamily)
LNTVAAIKDSDEFVFQEVFTQYHDKLYFYILSKTKSAYLAEEVVQITFFKLWKYRSSLKENIPLINQLFRITKTTLMSPSGGKSLAFRRRL